MPQGQLQDFSGSAVRHLSPAMEHLRGSNCVRLARCKEPHLAQRVAAWCCLTRNAINHWHFMAFLISLVVFAGMIPSGDILSPSLSTGGCITKSKWTTASGDGWRDFTGHQHSEIIWNYIAHGAYIICSRVGWPNYVEKHQKHVFLTFNFSSKIWNI